MSAIKSFNAYMNDIQTKKVKLEADISGYDRQQNDILHFIELDKYDAVGMVKACKQLKHIRQERRKVKDEYEEVVVVWKRLGNLKLGSCDRKSYKYQTDALDGIKHQEIIKTQLN